MKRLIALMMCAVSFGAAAQSTPSFNPDYNGDGFIGIDDILGVLSTYNLPWVEGSNCGIPLLYQNSYYETTEIGSQCWFAENLRTETYSNGDTIANMTDNLEYISTVEGVQSIWQNGSNTELLAYGRLYNIFAILDSRGLCPTGWRVPSIEDFHELREFVSPQDAPEGSAYGGSKLRTTYGWAQFPGNWWYSPGTNETGFSSVPAGFRDYYNGGFDGIDMSTYFWSTSTAPDAAFGDNNYYYMALSINDVVSINFNDGNSGYSVRCIKDTE